MCPYLSRYLWSLLLLLTALVGGTNQAWADTETFTLTSSSPTLSKSGITISGGTASNDGYNVNNTTMNLAASDDITITNVAFTVVSGREGGTITVSSGSYSSSIWSGLNLSNSSATLTTTANFRVTQMVVTYTTAETPSGLFETITTSSTERTAWPGTSVTTSANMMTTGKHTLNEVDYLKYRTGDDNSTWTFNVNQGYKVTGISIKGYSNNSVANIPMTSMTIDGGSNILSESFTFTPKGNDNTGIKIFTKAGLSARKKIVCTFDNSYVTTTSGDNQKQIAAVITIYYEAIPTHTVTYDLNSGTGTVPTQTAVAEGDDFTVDSGDGITKDGFTFAGWNDGTADYAAGSSYTMGASDVTLTAQWNVIKINASRFSLQGGSQPILTSGISNKNYYMYFGGPDCTEKPEISAFTAESSDASVTVGSLSISSTSKSDNGNTLWTLTVPVTIVSAGTPRINVNFAGDTHYQSINGYFDLTIGTPYTVNFASNNEEQGTVAAVTDKKVNGANYTTGAFSSGASIPSGQSAIFTATPNSGYLFDNWHDGSNFISENPYTTQINSNLNLTANFIESRTINVAFATGCESMGIVALYARDTNTPNLSGVEIKKNVNLDVTATANDGYDFLGWKTSADGTGEFVSQDAKFQKKAEDIASGTTYYAYFAETPVDPTKVGKEDNSSAYNSDHSQVYTLATGKTRHITFINHSDEAQNYHNWILSVASDDEKAVGSPDIMVLRADNWDNLNRVENDILTYQNSETASAFNWSTFKNDLNGATVDMYVTNSGNHIYVNTTMTKDARVYKYSAICNDKTYGDNAYFCFTVDHSYITNLNVEEEAQAYELSYNLKEFGGSAIANVAEGNVTIKNAQGLALRKGTYVPNGEQITYEAATKAESPRYVYYKWEGAADKTATNVLTVAAADLNPTVLFLDKPIVSTPENIVTLTHPASNETGFKMYFTLDNSDPRSSATRYEYPANNLVAIRENMNKVRAVAYIDGVYSNIQGTNVNYEPVTVLEARGSGVSADGMFTGNTCTTTIGFNKEVNWTNAKSPNSLIDVEQKVYRALTSEKSITINLNSTSAKEFVVGFASNSASSSRSLSSLSVDGSNVSYTTSGQTSNSENETINRLIITPSTEIEQGSEVTFTFNGNVTCTYIEVFGTSLEEQCEAPTNVPYQYDATNGWSYQIIPAAGTIVNYTVNGGEKHTSTTTVTVNAEDIAAGQIIKAWSTKDGMGGSARVTMTDAATIKPVIRFAPTDNATYNKHNTSWIGGVAPTLEIYPSSLLSSVTYTTLDAGVGSATNGQASITIGDGQGVTTITASVTVNGVAGLTDGTYTKDLTLTLSDGYADKLGKNYTPKVGGTREVKDDAGNLILTLGFGGWTHGSRGSEWYNDGNPTNGEDKSDSKKKQFDEWPTTSEYAGEQDAPAERIDGYSWQSQATTDARSETKGSVVWEIQDQKVKSYSLPCRGAYITVTPEKNGKLTIYLVQNGCINETGSDNGLISGSPRVYYWFDSEGNCIPADAITVTQNVQYTPESTLNGKSAFKTQILEKWKVNLADKSTSENKDLFDALDTYWAKKQATDDEEAIPYHGGYFLMKKAYIKYVVTLLAGKTYYFFSNGSKMGYSGLNFAPTESVQIGLPQGGKEDVNTVAELNLYDAETFSKPANTTTYNTVTLNRTFKPNTWNTICLPFSVSKEQVERVFGKGTTFVGYGGYADGTLSLIYHAYDYLLPGQPYFIKPTGEGVELNENKIGDANGKITFKNVTITSNVDVKDNDYDADDTTFKFIGLFNGTSINPYDHYMNANGQIAYSSTKSVALKGYRAYLQNLTGANANVKNISYVTFDDEMDEPTSIEGLLEYLESEGVKVIPAGGVYNISGQKVADDATNLPAGLYIINGKKVIVK